MRGGLGERIKSDAPTASSCSTAGMSPELPGLGWSPESSGESTLGSRQLIPGSGTQPSSLPWTAVRKRSGK